MSEPPSRATYLQVDLDQLSKNLLNIRSHVAPAKVMVLLKANAYGHGLEGVGPHIASLVDYIGVAIVEEGIQLRSMGIATPIMVLGGVLPGELPSLFQNELTLSASSPELLEEAESAAAGTNRKPKVHLKIDTGMERTGVHDYEAESFIERSLECRHVEIEGIYTHFANSETGDLSHAKLQLQRFRDVLGFYERRGIPAPPLRHTANSGAILQLPDSHLDMVRAGVLFYGIYPGAEARRTVPVLPAARWVASVVHSKITQPGRPVSYGSLWTPERPTRIITIACGYGDGYFRRMSNQAKVIVNGRICDQVGRICMDQFMVNVVDDQVQAGDEVVLLGQDASGLRITAEDLAAWAGTNEYEVMTNISARVPRRFVQA